MTRVAPLHDEGCQEQEWRGNGSPSGLEVLGVDPRGDLALDALLGDHQTTFQSTGTRSSGRLLHRLGSAKLVVDGQVLGRDLRVFAVIVLVGVVASKLLQESSERALGGHQVDVGALLDDLAILNGVDEVDLR